MIFMKASAYTFSKSERLYLKKDIDFLFKEGAHSFAFPFKYIYSYTDKTENQVLITVPKKKFPKAIQRNRIKRLIRESYRLNKQVLHSLPNIHVHIAFIYVHDLILSYADIEKRVNLILHNIVQRYKA